MNQPYVFLSLSQVHTFRGPHWCEYCANFMWGLIAQGVRCSGNPSPNPSHTNDTNPSELCNYAKSFLQNLNMLWQPEAKYWRLETIRVLTSTLMCGYLTFFNDTWYKPAECLLLSVDYLQWHTLCTLQSIVRKAHPGYLGQSSCINAVKSV